MLQLCQLIGPYRKKLKKETANLDIWTPSRLDGHRFRFFKFLEKYNHLFGLKQENPTFPTR